MPWSSPHPCGYRGCGRATRKRHCDEHAPLFAREQAKRMEERIGSAVSRGYDHEWRAVRREFIARFPTCRCGKPAAMVHHVIPVAEGGARLDPDNLEPLCWRCHALTHRAKGGNPNGY